MELTVVTHTFDPEKGGKERFTWNLVNNFLDFGCRVHIVANQSCKISRSGIRFHSVPRWGKTLGLHRLTFAYHAHKKCQELSTDFVFTHANVGFGDILRVGGVHQAYVDRMAESKHGQLKRYLYQYGKKLSISSRIASRLEQKSFQDNDYEKIVVISEFLKRELLEYYPDVKESQVEVIYNGVNTTRYNLEKRNQQRETTRGELGYDEEEMVILFVGNDYQRKGLDRVFPILRSEESAQLLVVGEGEEFDLQPSMEERVTWMGSVDDVTPYYAAGDVLVLPSLTDGFGLVVLEALAMGLYVFASETAGASELLTREWIGESFVTLEQQGLTALPRHVVRSSEMVQKRAQYAGKFNWENVARQYYRVISGSTTGETMMDPGSAPL